MPLTEITLPLPNQPGTLAAVSRLLAEKGINVSSIHVESFSRATQVRLIVSDPKGAIPLLRKAGYHVTTDELIAVHLEDRAGSFLRVLDALAAAKVNVDHVILLVQREGSKSLVALGVDELAKARRILQKAGFLADRVQGISNADLVAAPPSIPQESVGLLL
jgi:hypothetical protein